MVGIYEKFRKLFCNRSSHYTFRPYQLRLKNGEDNGSNFRKLSINQINKDFMEPLTLNPVTDPVVTPLMPKKPFPWATIIITTIAILSLTAAIYLFIQNRTLTRQLATPLSPSPTSSADPTA